MPHVLASNITYYSLLITSSSLAHPPGHLVDQLAAQAQAVQADALVVAVEGTRVLGAVQLAGEAVGGDAAVTEDAAVGEAHSHARRHDRVLDVLAYHALDRREQLRVEGVGLGV